MRWPTLLCCIALCVSVLVIDASAFHVETTSNNNNLRFMEHRERNLANRIVGGTPAQAGEFPFFALYGIGDNDIRHCGGSLIAEDIVLTAAHCFYGESLTTTEASVWIGLHDKNQLNLGEKRSISAVRRHPDYNNAAPYNYHDVMLLQLGAPSTRPIIAFNTDPAVPVDNSLVTTIGFGVSEFQNPNTISDVLMKVDVNVVNINTCSSNSYSGQLDPSLHICAAAPGKDACQNDSGGPLLRNGVVVGLVSFGTGCAEPDYPGVYSSVSNPSAIEFIRSGVCELSSNPPFDCSEPGPPPPVPGPPSPGPSPTGGGFCFSSANTVLVQGRSDAVSMAQLEIGDRVQVASSPDRFEPVYSFCKHSPHGVAALFLQIHASGLTSPLELTANHMLFVQRRDSTSKQAPIAVPAGELVAGDQLVIANGNGTITTTSLSTVTHIQSVTRVGFYAPMTYSGNLVVNGALVSAYATLPTGPLSSTTKTATCFLQFLHWLSHTPHRLFCRFAFQYCRQEKYDENSGMSDNVERSYRLYTWWNTLPSSWSWILLWPAGVGLLILVLLEASIANTIPALTGWCLGVAGLVVVRRWQQRRQCYSKVAK